MNPLRQLLIAVVLGLAACGGKSPSSPTTQSLNLAGSWSGSWQFTASGATITDTITATLTQTGTEAAGSWTAQSGATGQVTRLMAAANTSGSMTISQTTLTGTVCTTTTTVTGSATASTLELTIAAIAPTATCQWPTSQQFSLKKQ